MPAKNSITVQCSHCGNELKRPLNRIKKSKLHFCDRSCQGQWKRTQSGPLSACYSSVVITCDNCGIDFRRKPTHVKRSKRHFCSRECRLKFESGDDIECLQCGKKTTRNKFRVNAVKKTFCDMHCYAAWKQDNLTGSDNPHWKGGLIKYYGPNWRVQRNAARRRDNYTCQCCGMTKKQSGNALDVHHIKSFKSFNYIANENDTYLQANDLDNLVSLCRSCHSKIESGALSPSFIQRKTEPSFSE